MEALGPRGMSDAKRFGVTKSTGYCSGLGRSDSFADSTEFGMPYSNQIRREPFYP